MQRNSVSAIRPLDPSVVSLALESGFLFRGEASPLNLGKEENRAFDQPLQTPLSEADQELATLLREVRTKSDAAPRSTPQSQPISELLMRAVECAVKQYMLRVELSNLAFTDELTGLFNRRGFLPIRNGN
jgi:hypothetical protein